MHFLMPEKCKLFPPTDQTATNSLPTVALTNDFDLNDINQEEKIKELHQQLESLMLRRLKRDVLSELPTKSERILRVEMSALQTLFYKNILTKVALRLVLHGAQLTCRIRTSKGWSRALMETIISACSTLVCRTRTDFVLR
jgi:SNF2 family DNA or RNA helicase